MSVVDGGTRAPLGSEFGWAPEDVAGYKAKAGAFRGLIHAVGEKGLREQVLVGLPAATREVFDKPPLSVAYMPGVHFQYVLRELDRIGGDDLVRELGRNSILLGPVNMMRPLVEGTLRLFGATPHAFYKKIPAIMKGQIQGMSFEYGFESDERATLLVRFDTIGDLPPRTWVYWAGVFSSCFDLCKVEGQAVAEVTADPGKNAAIITCSWSSSSSSS